MEKDIATLDEEEGEITLRRNDMMMDTLLFYFVPLPLRDSPRDVLTDVQVGLLIFPLMHIRGGVQQYVPLRTFIR